MANNLTDFVKLWSTIQIACLYFHMIDIAILGILVDLSANTRSCHVGVPLFAKETCREFLPKATQHPKRRPKCNVLTGTWIDNKLCVTTLGRFRDQYLRGFSRNTYFHASNLETPIYRFRFSLPHR